MVYLFIFGIIMCEMKLNLKCDALLEYVLRTNVIDYQMRLNLFQFTLFHFKYFINIYRGNFLFKEKWN